MHIRHSVEESVVQLLQDTEGLDQVGEVRAEMAVALAHKIDECRGGADDEKAQGSVATALAACAKQLEEVLVQIQAVADDTKQQLRDLYNADPD